MQKHDQETEEVEKEGNQLDVCNRQNEMRPRETLFVF